MWETELDLRAMATTAKRTDLRLNLGDRVEQARQLGAGWNLDERRERSDVGVRDDVESFADRAGNVGPVRVCIALLERFKCCSSLIRSF